MANYPKNPVSNFPSGQEIPSSWQNRRSPFDDSPVSETGFSLQDNTGSTQITVEQDLQSEVGDGSADDVAG
jgi:hypothetical protein